MAKDQRAVSQQWNGNENQVLYVWGNGKNERQGKSDQKENLID